MADDRERQALRKALAFPERPERPEPAAQNGRPDRRAGNGTVSALPRNQRTAQEAALVQAGDHLAMALRLLLERLETVDPRSVQAATVLELTATTLERMAGWVDGLAERVGRLHPRGR